MSLPSKHWDMFHFSRQPPRCRVAVGRRRQSRCRAKNRPKITRVNRPLDLHNHNTRRGHRLHIPRINHAFAQLNIRHSIIQTVNSMPDNVIDQIRTHNLKGFSTYAKNYFISTYETTCEIVIYVNGRPSTHKSAYCIHLLH